MQSYTLKVPEKLETLIELRTKEEHVDTLTALRELIYIGAEDYIIELYGKGYISLSKASKLLGKSVHEIIRLAQIRGIKTGATSTQQVLSEKTAKKLLQR